MEAACSKVGDMPAIKLSFILHAILAITISSVSACPDGFDSWHEGYCYQHLYLGTWDMCAQECRRIGGQLASIHTALENKRVTDVLRTLTTEQTWIGLQCQGIPMWMDRTAVDFENNITADNGRPCMVDYAHPSAYAINSNGGWDRLKFDDKLIWAVCRHRRRNGDRCSDYDEIEGSNTCYKIQTKPVGLFNPYFSSVDFDRKERGFQEAWYDAENKCKQGGAHLISIHDPNVNKFVANLLDDAETVGLSSGAFHIGLQSQASPKGDTFTWTDGSDVNYTYYEFGFPVDILGQCTTMETTSGAKWISTQCTENALPYICGRPVNDPIQAPHCPGNPNFMNSGTIMSPSYPGGSGPVNCQYYLTVPQGKRVNLVIDDFNTNLCCDKLNLFDGTAATTPFAT